MKSILKSYTEQNRTFDEDTHIFYRCHKNNQDKMQYIGGPLKSYMQYFF